MNNSIIILINIILNLFLFSSCTNVHESSFEIEKREVKYFSIKPGCFDSMNILLTKFVDIELLESSESEEEYRKNKSDLNSVFFDQERLNIKNNFLKNYSFQISDSIAYYDTLIFYEEYNVIPSGYNSESYVTHELYSEGIPEVFIETRHSHDWCRILVQRQIYKAEKEDVIMYQELETKIIKNSFSLTDDRPIATCYIITKLIVKDGQLIPVIFNVTFTPQMPSECATARNVSSTKSILSCGVCIKSKTANKPHPSQGMGFVILLANKVL